MSRPLRLEYPGALFHVYARGNRKEEIFRDDSDRKLFLRFLAESVKRFGWILTAYTLMPNHFHLVVQLTLKTLSRGMQWLNGRYSQAFNKRHGCVGHVFQGRFKAPLVERESYFLQVVRYVVLNPVEAHLVARPEDYAWSSHRAVIGEVEAPDWLAVDDLLVQFAPKRDDATALYRQFVNEAIGSDWNPWKHLEGGLYLGSEDWLEHVQKEIDLKPRSDEHPRCQRVVGSPSMDEVVATVARRFAIDESRVRHAYGRIPRMVAAWIGWHEALLKGADIASGLQLRSASHVSALIRDCDRELNSNPSLREAVDRCVATIRRKSSNSQT